MSRIAYRPDIDGLRAVAVLSVLGFHAFPEVFPGGFIGVDAFFVISGFLITSILRSEIEQGAWSLAGFYARRVLRIFPALMVVLWFCLLVGWYTMLGHEYKLLGKHVAAGAGFIANLSLWFEAGYFDKASELKPLLHLWSLGIEEQFYILWPFWVWLAWRFGRRYLGFTAALFLFSLVVSCVLVLHDRTQAFYSPLSRVWELAAGAALAFSGKNMGSMPAFLRKAGAGWLAMGGLVASVLLFRPEYPFPGLLALIPVLATALLIASPGGPDSGTARLLASRPMVAIGLISYPLYLWHWPLLSFAQIIEGGQPSMAIRAALLLSSLILATLTYWLIERPMRLLPRRWAVGLLVVGMVVVGALGFNVYSRDGLERIRHKRIVQLDEQVKQDFVDFDKAGLIPAVKCDRPFKYPEREVCLQNDTARPATAVVLGDSHAAHAYWGLAEAMARTGENLKLLGRGACVPFLGYVAAISDAAKQCQPNTDDTLKEIASTQAIRKVALVFRGRYLQAGSPAQEVEAFQRGLDATLQLLTQAGKRVYYFLPIVEPGFDPRLCVGQLPLGRKPPHACEISLMADADRSRATRDAAATVLKRYPAVVVVDPNIAICGDAVCQMFHDRRSIFQDENHLSYYGSLVVGARLNLD